ncbi:transcriptional regulator domain-containing protein [Aureimonas ureilytica]|uniref:transcriptional regulator domain-containing protein n=1 Tax=Aureimonas ureilytica TaxID=401562 RepID=UPI000734242D|nr:DUF6499 domain-containing protein [Aureimonas ureilytica]
MRKWGLPVTDLKVNLSFTHEAVVARRREDLFVKPDQSRWRDDSAYDYMETLIVEDLAWECLRRNSAYQSDFSKHLNQAGPGSDGEAAIAQHWGLRFRRPAKSQRTGSADPLDTRCQSVSGGSHQAT